MIGMEVKDAIQSSDSDEKIITKINENTVTKGDDSINITKSNAIIFNDFNADYVIPYSKTYNPFTHRSCINSSVKTRD